MEAHIDAGHASPDRDGNRLAHLNFCSRLDTFDRLTPKEDRL